MGDGVLAYFGYPRADEHDAERAVRAGLALVEAVPGLGSATAASMQVRVGIATGLVVVGDLIGEGEARERGVVGETPNLAARLQGLAESGSVASPGPCALPDDQPARTRGRVPARGHWRSAARQARGETDAARPVAARNSQSLALCCCAIGIAS
jgi:class 3 adenylate cyclase